MADKVWYLVNVQTQEMIPVALHDNGDGTWSLGVNAAVNLGDVTVSPAAEAAEGAALPAKFSVVAGDDGTDVHPLQMSGDDLRVTDAAVGALSKNAGTTDAGTLRVITAADGPLNTAVGGVNDAAVTTNTTGSLSAKLRGLVAILADVWNSTLHYLTVSIAEKALSIANGTSASVGDTAIIAAPGAGNRLVVSHFTIQGESTTATTLILKDGATAKFRVLAQNQGDGLSVSFPAGRGWKLAENAALNLNLSGANQCGYSVVYWTEPTS